MDARNLYGGKDAWTAHAHRVLANRGAQCTTHCEMPRRNRSFDVNIRVDPMLPRA
jgi:hypothetical protein